MEKYQDGIMKFKYNQPPTSALRYGGLSAFLETFVLNQSLCLVVSEVLRNASLRAAARTL